MRVLIIDLDTICRETLLRLGLSTWWQIIHLTGHGLINSAQRPMLE